MEDIYEDEDDDEGEAGLENLADDQDEMTLGNFYTDLESKQPCLTKYSHEEGESVVTARVIAT